ncbi:hypothetical protein ACO2Q8_09360 [Larkinella sp. VNQ87]|uniref:hypothetical protein n=1 Tax=Larkinella sp. VNQ87 TaxID=3400921 RepID=UPI003BFDABA6
MLQVGANYYLTDRIGLEASASTTSFPVTFSSVGIGLVILTGVQGTHPNTTYEAPQTAKGRWVIGGSFRLTTEAEKANLPGNERSSETAFSLSPSVGWFVAKNLLLGVSVPLGFSKTGNDSAFSYGLTPYIKKYISDNRLRPFVGGNLSYFAIRNKGNGARSTNQQIGLAVDAGLAYLLGERFIVEAGLGSVYVNRQIYPETSTYKSWNAGLSASLQPGFTIQYVFD